MKRCVLMFGILLIVVIVASILENRGSKEVLVDGKLVMTHRTAENALGLKN